MKLEQAIIERIEHDYLQVKGFACKKEAELFNFEELCTEDEQICLKYLYAYMPLSDLANYDRDLFLKFVRHSLWVRKTVKWCQDLDDLTFLNYVLQYRINNEDIEYYSEVFYETLMPRIKDLSLEEAIIEVNYWCFEKATYQSTDIRTLSPLSTIKNAYGRCGEESVFTVAALRSVGIPARQCYTPRWVHCDDNHAWVEVLVEGEWRFIGACEPEIKLDRGWFREPASKGMLMHVRNFAPMIGTEQMTKQVDRFAEINVTKHYADTKTIEILLKDTEGRALPGVEIEFLIVNFAQFYPLIKIETNQDGLVTFETGLGDLVLSVVKDGETFYQKIDVRSGNSFEFVLGKEAVSDQFTLFDLVPPVGGITDDSLSDDEKEVQSKRNTDSENIRKSYEATLFNDSTSSLKVKELVECYEEEITEETLTTLTDILINSRGNYSTIIKFLEKSQSGLLIDKVKLLKTLSKKDYSDCRLEVLEDHLSARYNLDDEDHMRLKLYSEEMSDAYIFSPRIKFEVLSSFRKGLNDWITRKDHLREHPEAIYTLVDKHVLTNDKVEYSTLSSSPLNTLKIGIGNQMSKQILTIAIARTLLIPARFNPMTDEIEFYKEGQWQPFDQSLVFGHLEITCGDDVAYEKDYTVSRKVDSSYQVLDLLDCEKINGMISAKLPAGDYRLMLTKRLSNGTVNGYLSHFTLVEGEVRSISAEAFMKTLKGSNDSLCDCIEDFEIASIETKETLSLASLIKEQSVLAWINIGGEPTEHLLNEWIESYEAYNKQGVRVIVLVENEDIFNLNTFKQVYKLLDNIEVYIGMNGLKSMAKAFQECGVSSDILPLVATIDNELNLYPISSGYNVGTGKMLLEKVVEKK